MTSGWNWLDWVLVIYVVFSALRGLRLGFMRSSLGLAGLIVAVLAAKVYSPVLARWAENRTALPVLIQDSLQSLSEWGILGPFLELEPEAIADGLLLVLAFAVVALGVAMLVGILAAVLARGLRYAGFGLLDDFLGLAFGVGKALVLAAIVLGLWASLMPFVGPGWGFRALAGSDLAGHLLDLFYYLSPLVPGA